jgi:hypothetical protein
VMWPATQGVTLFTAFANLPIRTQAESHDAAFFNRQSNLIYV